MPAERKIVSVAISPSIGLARAGNSPGEFFYSLEVPGSEPIDPNRFRDRKGRINRKAARFRLYGLDADGGAVCEITAKDAEITQTVHVANTKAAWFRFDEAVGIQASEGKVVGVSATISALCNPQVNLEDRGELVSDPGPRTIAGAKTNARGRDKAYASDTGEFAGKPDYHSAKYAPTRTAGTSSASRTISSGPELYRLHAERPRFVGKVTEASVELMVR